MEKNAKIRARDEIDRDLKTVFLMEKEITDEKKLLYAELRKSSKETETPITVDNGEVIERHGLFGLKKIKASIVPIKKKDGLSMKDKYNLYKFPVRTYFIEMFFSNGTVKEWVLKSKSEVFAFKGRMYYLKHNNVWFHVTRNQHKLYFHEDYVCPIDRKIIQIGDKNFFSVTPMNIKPLLAMEYVKALVSGDSMSKWLKISVLISALTLITVLISIFLKVKTAKGV